MDIYFEQVVKRKRNAKSIGIIVLTVFMLFCLPALCIALAYIIQAYFIYIGLFVLIIGIYLAWYIITSQRVEFEYSVNGGMLDIAKIVSKRKRKRLARIDIKEIDLFCKFNDKRIQEKNYAKQFYVAEDPKDKENTYAAVYSDPARGRCLLVFTPNEKIREGMKPHLKKDIVLEMFYHRGQRYD